MGIRTSRVQASVKGFGGKAHVQYSTKVGLPPAHLKTRSRYWSQEEEASCAIMARQSSRGAGGGSSTASSTALVYRSSVRKHTCGWWGMIGAGELAYEGLGSGGPDTCANAPASTA